MKNKRLIGLLLILFAVVICFALVTYQRVVSEQRQQAEIEAARIAEEERRAEEEKRLAEEQERLRKEEEEAIALEASADPNEIFSFSKKEKNVVLIMLDRAVGCYLPYIMEELPEVKEQFDGFVFYPNTVSYGSSTIFGVPAVYGGYEYTPEAMNNRPEEKLVDKHNEALKTLPKLFSDNGYKVVFCDPAIAGYSWTPDLTIFDDIENVRSFTFLTGANTEASALTQYQKFMKNYDFLNNLSSLTNNKSRKGTYIAIDNEITHRFLALSWPEYEPAEYVTNTGPRERVFSQDEKITLRTDIQLTHYHVNACALKLLGRWFDYLRELEVYDNTRIIIVADHGYGLGQYQDLIYGKYDLLYYNPLMMVKDFDSSEPLKTDVTFMTNADVPTILTDGLIKNATNPYTGNRFSDMVKKDEAHIFMGRKWDVSQNRGNTFDDNRYFVVKDNLFDINNWSTTKIDPPKSETGDN